MRRYAKRTTVTVGRSQDGIRQLVLDRGATGWAIGEDEGQAVITFRMNDRLLRFRLTLPAKDDAKEERRIWRALFMAIKAKLVIAEEGIETFDEVFLVNIVLPGGDTVGDRVLVDVRQMLESGKTRVIKLLPAGSK